MLRGFVVLAVLILPLAVFAAPMPQLAPAKIASLRQAIVNYKHDQRQAIKKWDFPYTAIGSIFLTKQQFACSAALVGPDIVLTNAHCFIRDGAIVKDGIVYEVMRHRTKVRETVKVIEIQMGTEKLAGRSYGEDWALVRLAKPVGHKYGWFGVQALPQHELVKLASQHKIHMSGYSVDKEKSFLATTQSNCAFKSYSSAYDTPTHDCSGVFGSSGSPLFIVETKGNKVTSATIVAVNRGEVYETGKNPGEKQMDYSDLMANAAVSAEKFVGKLKEMLGAR